MEAIIEKGQMGTLNIVPDVDNIIRHYSYYQDDQGYRIPSLAYQMGKHFNWNLHVAPSILINWPGKGPLAHQHISFSDFYLDIQKKVRERPKDEFKNKIILIGATAPSLFDNKTTPVAKIHPGVDILATSIDNLKNTRFLEDLPAWFRFGLAVLFLISAAWIQRRGFQTEYNKRFLWAGQVLLIILSWISLQWVFGSPKFYDLSAPFAFGALFLTLMGLRNKFVQDALEYRGLFRKTWVLFPSQATIRILSANEWEIKSWLKQYAPSALLYSLQRYPMLPGTMDLTLSNQWILITPGQPQDYHLPFKQLSEQVCLNTQDQQVLQNSLLSCLMKN
jgi:hypothetical protein